MTVWQNRTLQMQNGNLKVVIREMAQRVKESEAREINMDQSMKTMETVLASAVTQAIGQALDRSIDDAISWTLASQRFQCTQVERPDSILAQVQPGNQYRGNNVSHHSGAHALTHMGSRP